jgi:hypothetical protein
MKGIILYTCRHCNKCKEIEKKCGRTILHKHFIIKKALHHNDAPLPAIKGTGYDSERIPYTSRLIRINEVIDRLHNKEDKIEQIEKLLRRFIYDPYMLDIVIEI